LKTPNKISSVILWSVISAAFIGPGTVTTAVTAGSQYKLQLLWSVVFATVGCIVLQEISARISIASGMTFGQSLTKKFGTKKGRLLQWLVGGSVVFGCAAYEAGNILGAVAGLELLTGLSAKLLTVMVTLLAGIVLWYGGKTWISNIMMALVLIMGIAFFALAFTQPLSGSDLFLSSVIPRIPDGAEWIVLGLVGTTIVPYNIFIGAGISKGETIPLMRIGLSISVLIGGLITAAILVAGISVEKFGSFQELAAALSQQVGTWGGLALALGLFAAGFSSAITSPYASALIASTVFGSDNKNNIRAVWMAVLLTGFLFGISGVKPIPVILAVQAINGLVLPLLTLYLIIIVNDPAIVPTHQRHGLLYNVLLLVVLITVLLIGLNNLDKVISKLLSLSSESHVGLVFFATALVVGYAGMTIFRPGKASN
jgi:Mn2+/Fe2+ NRAMP family transporter